MVRLYTFKDNNRSIKCADFNGLVDQYNFISDEFKEKNIELYKCKLMKAEIIGGVGII